MANYSVTRAKHATLTANVVDTVSLSEDFDSVEVVNRGSAELYFTAEGQQPAIGGDNTYIVMPGGGVTMQPATNNLTVVKLVSPAATAYSVTGI
jgi:hypothetical protein